MQNLSAEGQKRLPGGTIDEKKFHASRAGARTHTK